MPKVTEDHRAARRRQITDATLRLISREGARHIAMSNIIAESGLSAGAIYTHFTSKEEILASVIERTLTQSSDHIAEALTLRPLPHPADLLALIGPDGHGGPTALVQVWGQVATESDLGPYVEEHVAANSAALADFATAWLRERGVTNPAIAAHLGELLMGLSQAHTIHAAFAPTLNPAALREAARAAIDALVTPNTCTSSPTKEPNHE